MNRAKLRAWYQASRPPFFVATLVPLVLGAAIAGSAGGWSALRWGVVLLASFLVHLCTNLANDYFEYDSGADAGDAIGGSRVLQQRKITPREIRNALIILYAIAMVCGIWILWVSRVWWLAPIMIFSFFSSLFYTAPPFRYGYYGLGELFVGLNMGPIMVVGTAAALTGRFIPRAFWISIPVGLTVAMILYYQSLPDMDSDRAAGKRTLTVRLGKRSSLWGFRLLVGATLGAILVLVFQGLLHPAALLCLFTIYFPYKVDQMIRVTRDWKDLHDRGGRVRLFYLMNGLILILAV